MSLIFMPLAVHSFLICAIRSESFTSRPLLWMYNVLFIIDTSLPCQAFAPFCGTDVCGGSRETCHLAKSNTADFPIKPHVSATYCNIFEETCQAEGRKINVKPHKLKGFPSIFSRNQPESVKFSPKPAFPPDRGWPMRNKE